MKSIGLIFIICVMFVGCVEEDNFFEQEVKAPDALELLKRTIDRKVLNQISPEKPLFDWNEQSDDFICEALPLVEHIIVLGLKSTNEIFDFDAFLSDNSTEITLWSKDSELAVYYLKLSSCDLIAELRAKDAVQFVELNYFIEDLSNLLNVPPDDTPSEAEVSVYGEKNPGKFVQGSMKYLDYLASFDGGVAEHAYKQNMDKVYHEMGYFGSSEVGVAILDNGVREEAVGYLSGGPGGFDAFGFYRWNWRDQELVDDGPYPQPYDGFSIWQYITPSYNHGTSRGESVYGLSPHTYLTMVRASPIFIMLTPSQLVSTAEAIKAMADNDNVRIISMAMGGIYVSNQMIAAIKYFNSKDKIMVCAAGSTIPGLKQKLGIIFPGNLSETVSVSGIKDLEETDGRWVLGFTSHGGEQNDFIIEPAESSSEGVSAFAGMLATIWAINPGLTRDELIQLAIEHSNFNIEQSAKHPIFGWGKVDMHAFALAVEGTL